MDMDAFVDFLQDGMESGNGMHERGLVESGCSRLRNADVPCESSEALLKLLKCWDTAFQQDK
jgi:hypothetical protein